MPEGWEVILKDAKYFAFWSVVLTWITVLAGAHLYLLWRILDELKRGR